MALTESGAGIVLVACVSGAQLSNYATFLTDPQMAPLSIVMTSLSTASAVFVTPLLLLLLIGKRLPVDVKGMVFSITQIVVAPIAVGLLLNRYYLSFQLYIYFLFFFHLKGVILLHICFCSFFPRICKAIRPFLPPLSVLVASICTGAPLALNIESIKSPLGVTLLLLVVAFHLSSFIAGYVLSGFIFHDAPDVKALQRTISFETGKSFLHFHPANACRVSTHDFSNSIYPTAGMQSSLLALALANKFFEDPVVSIPPAISVSSPIWLDSTLQSYLLAI